ncbi:MAG: AAA family ATPase, partial [Solirubrobacteraceae bacterium]
MADIAGRLKLDAAQTRRRLDPDALPFETTADVAALRGTIGQTRALEAIDFGLEIGSSGYNLFLAGPAGSGRESTVLDYLERVAARRPVPDDIVYVHNFREPERPQALRLPAGRGAKLRADLDELLRWAQDEIPRAFEGEEFERRRQEALTEVERRRDEIGEEMQRAASERGFAIQQTQAGIVSVPVANGRPLSPQEIAGLPAEARAELQQRAGELNERMAALMRDLRRLGDEAGERTGSVVRQTAHGVISPRLDDLREHWAGEAGVVELLDAIKREIPERLEDFRPADQAAPTAPQLAQVDPRRRERNLARYRVNVFVDHAESGHAPVVVERNPTYYNLVGRVDYRASFGAMETDFEQIRSGALHRADGGFLVLHVLDVVRHPAAWEALKRALLDRVVRIENLAEQVSPVPTATLRPEPVALDVKVVLIGPPETYHLLYGLDEDFRDLFKVKAEFAPDMDWNDEHIANYAAFISRCVRSEQLRHFDRTAVARVVEHGARLR